MPRYLLRSAASHLDEMESARAPAAHGPSFGGIPRSLSLARGSKLVSRRRLGLFKQGGRVLLYLLGDLRQVGFLEPLGFGRLTGKELLHPVNSGETWEVPDF